MDLVLDVRDEHLRFPQTRPPARVQAASNVINAEADEVQRVSDLVGDTGGELPHGGEPLRLAQPFLQFAVLAKLLDHFVEAFGQFGNLVCALHLDGLRQIPGGDPLRGFHHAMQRLGVFSSQVQRGGNS